MRYITVGKCETPATVKQFLKAHGYTEHQIRHVKYVEKGLLKNGVPCRAIDLLQNGDTVQILVEDAIYKEALPWPVLYEDEEVLVIDKPAGLVVHPEHGHQDDSLVAQLGGKGYIIGRLDQDTSGVLMLAKNAIAAERLQKQRWDGRFIRTYIAWVHGIPTPHKGIVNMPIGRVAPDVNRMTTDPLQCKDGKLLEAVTHYEVLESRDGISRVQFHIDTGRTHQIRVHMASIGHSLVGDSIYGNGPELGWKHTALYAWKIKWQHPHSGEVIEIQSQRHI